MKLIIENSRQTKKIGRILALEIKSSPVFDKGAFVIALEGDLGGGKTTFTQGFAEGFGIKEKILSPTFVVLKHFDIHKHTLKNSQSFRSFYHMDCYRLESPSDLLAFGFKEIIKNPENIVLIEWADKIRRVLPKNHLKIKFKYLDNNQREISFES